MAPSQDQIQLGASDLRLPSSEDGVRTILDSLRLRISEAIDSVFEDLGVTPAGGDDSASSEVDHSTVEAGDAFGRWTYRWPDKQEEEFVSGRWYRTGDLRLRLAWTTRWAWGSERGRAIVFQQLGSPDSTTYYPLAEFVESDEPGVFAAPMPDPERPRSLLSWGAQLPSRFGGSRVVRADEAFSSIDNGPSLRLLLAQDDETAMIRHACWVGQVRGRL